jgi:signal transduction histidine kinase
MALDRETRARVVHDLLNPLSSALGYAQILADPGRELSPELRREFAREVADSLQRACDRLPELLDL